MKIKLTKSFWIVALLVAIIALLWLPNAPKEISPATAFFGLGAVTAVVYAGYRFVRWLWAKTKKPAA